MKSWVRHLISHGAVSGVMAVLLAAGTGCANVVAGDGGTEESDEDADGIHDECSEGAFLPCHGFDWYQACVPTPEGNRWSECTDPCAGGCSTPLVLAFHDEPVRFLSEMTGAFDLTGEARSVATDWPSAATPWLALDRNENGLIDDGGELFGSATLLAGGRPAPNGFVALRELDSNADGAITPLDPAWPRLLVWSDTDADRTSTPGELTSLEAAGIVSLSTRDWTSPRCDALSNCEVERASMTYLDGAGRLQGGAVVDVYLRFR